MAEFILDELREAVRERERTEKVIREIVVAARGEGHSWEVIARMIGVTRQAAQQRYGKGAGE
jgi:hypothetical protein